MGTCNSIESQAKNALDQSQGNCPPFQDIITNPKNNINFFKIVDDSNPNLKHDLISSVLCKRGLSSKHSLELLTKIKTRLTEKANQNSSKPQLGDQASYIEYAVTEHNGDLNLFNFVLDNFFFETDVEYITENGKTNFESSSTSVRLLCALAARPRSIEMLRAFISSGKMSPLCRNDSDGASDKNDATGENQYLFIKRKTPLEIACENLNVDAAREFCVAGVGGRNYFDCVEALFSFRHVAKFGPSAEEKATNILLTLLAQPGFDKQEILCGSKHKMEKSLEDYLKRFQIIVPESSALVLSARVYGGTQFAACLVSNGASDFPSSGVRSLALERACSKTGEFKSIEMKSSARATSLIAEAFSSRNNRYKWLIEINRKDDRGRTLLDWAKANGLKEAADILVVNGAV